MSTPEQPRPQFNSDPPVRRDGKSQLIGVKALLQSKQQEGSLYVAGSGRRDQIGMYQHAPDRSIVLFFASPPEPIYDHNRMETFMEELVDGHEDLDLSISHAMVDPAGDRMVAGIISGQQELARKTTNSRIDVYEEGILLSEPPIQFSSKPFLVREINVVAYPDQEAAELAYRHESGMVLDEERFRERFDESSTIAVKIPPQGRIF